MRVVRTRRSQLALLAVAASLALPGGALAQSAGDEQYTDPFGQQEPGAGQQEPGAGQQEPGAGQQEPATQEQQPAPAPEQPAEEPSTTPAPGGNGSAEPAPAAETAQEASPTLPRTGAPLVLLAATGYALLLAGIAIRRKA
jgi:hypothetical protein